MLVLRPVCVCCAVTLQRRSDLSTPSLGPPTGFPEQSNQAGTGYTTTQVILAVALMCRTNITRSVLPTPQGFTHGTDELMFRLSKGPPFH